MKVPFASVLAGSLFWTSAAWANHPPVSVAFGTAVHEGIADREIRIGSDTRWVNVNGGETIKFVVDTSNGPRSFIWRFDTTTESALELNRIAPAGVAERGRVRVYVGPNPLYQG